MHKYSAQRETNTDDFFGAALNFYCTVALLGLRGQGLDSHEFHQTVWYRSLVCIILPHALDTHVYDQSVHGINRTEINFSGMFPLTFTALILKLFIMFGSKNVFSNPKARGKNNDWQHGSVTLYWPHLHKASHPNSNALRDTSPASYSDPVGGRAVSLPLFNKRPVHSSQGFHVCPNTETLGQKKSPPERTPICVLIHSAGLDMSKQLAFTTLATLFTSHCQPHTHTHWSRILTADPTSSNELREINVLMVTQNKTSWFFVPLVA